MSKVYLTVIAATLAFSTYAQELNARVTVMANQVGNAVNRSTFYHFAKCADEFLNNRKWTSDVFAPNEKIQCNFYSPLNLQAKLMYIMPR